MTWNPPVALTITDADTGETEVYCLRNGQYVGSNSGKQFVAELFPACSPESVSTSLADFQAGQRPETEALELGWSNTQYFLSLPRWVETVQWAIAQQKGTYVSGGFGIWPYTRVAPI